MPTQSIDNALVRQFSDMFHITAQQEMSRTGSFVDFKSMSGDDLAYDTFGNVRSQQVTSRNQKVEFADADFDRRKLGRERHTVVIPVDASDVRGMLLDPTSAIIKGCMSELNRVKDRIVVRQALASVETGREFGTTVTFANDGGTTVNATAGLTYEKLLEIRKGFKKRDIDLRNVGFFITETEEEALLQEAELINHDFVTKRSVDGGNLLSVLGMDFVVFGSDPLDNDPILNVVSTTRDCIAVAITPQHSGIVMGLSKDITIKVQERTDLIETTQVVVTMEVGALRTEGVLVQKIQTTI